MSQGGFCLLSLRSGYSKISFQLSRDFGGDVKLLSLIPNGSSCAGCCHWRVDWAGKCNTYQVSKDHGQQTYLFHSRLVRKDLCVRNTTGEACRAMRENVTRNCGKIEKMATSRCKLIPKPCMEDPPVGAQIVQKRSNRSLSERVLTRVAHVQEPVLVPVDKKDQLHFISEGRS